MKNVDVIKTNDNINYLYSDFYNMFSFVSTDLLNKSTKMNCDKYDFFCKKKYFDNPLIDFKTKYSPDKIKINLANLRQLLIEVTDSCNLKCRYCGYGDLYDNFDKREAKQQQFSNVKLLVDYLAELWGSAYNISYDKNIKIGFYGGEPLLNMRLIKEIIEYLKLLKGLNVHFSYNMTTNGVLLNKYMDFLVENKFSLLM